MDKCGILTFHRTTNFGSFLQAYALYKKISDLGFDCEIIDYRCPAIEARESIAKKKLHSLPEFARYILYQRKLDKKFRWLWRFLKENAKLSSPYTPENVQNLNGEYTKFFVGSDIVWGTDITQNDYTFFLDFVEKPEQKFAFASSVGSYNMGGNGGHISKLLTSFQKIAVREEAAVKWVHAQSGQDAKWVCDPTMLLTAQQWDEIVQPEEYTEDYVLVYFQDDAGKCLEDAKRYASANGMKVRHINYSVFPERGIRKEKPTSLKAFLGLIRNARFVFTASYHGMLFSLYYHKEFVFYTRAHSDRVVSLARRLGVENNCADKMDIGNYQEVSYYEVERKMQAFREESVDVLMEMLRA